MLILRDEKEKGGEKRERELYLLISSFRGGTDNDWLLSSFILLLFCFFVFFSFLSSPPFFLFTRGMVLLWNRKSTKGVDFRSNSTKKFGLEINFS